MTTEPHYAIYMRDKPTRYAIGTPGRDGSGGPLTGSLVFTPSADLVSDYSGAPAGASLRLWPNLPRATAGATGDTTLSMTGTAFSLAKSRAQQDLDVQPARRDRLPDLSRHLEKRHPSDRRRNRQRLAVMEELQRHRRDGGRRPDLCRPLGRCRHPATG